MTLCISGDLPVHTSPGVPPTLGFVIVSFIPDSSTQQMQELERLKTHAHRLHLLVMQSQWDLCQQPYGLEWVHWLGHINWLVHWKHEIDKQYVPSGSAHSVHGSCSDHSPVSVHLMRWSRRS